MHIGLYCPVWPPGEHPNGVVTYVRIVRAELMRRGHRVSIFSGHCDPDASQGIHRVKVGSASPMWRAVQRRFGRGWRSEYDFGPYITEAVLRVHQQEPLDVFEMEESFGWCSHVARHTPVPVVAKLHGPAFLSLIDHHGESARRQLRIESEGAALRSARAIVAPSRSTLLDTATKYSLPPGEMVSIPNPIDSVVSSLTWNAQPEWADDVLFVGRFDHRKGGAAAIQAFAKLARSRPGLRLTFVGPDEGLSLAEGGVQHFDDYVRANVEPDIGSRIRFLGTCSSQKVQSLRLQCALTLIATRWESFGYVVAEAMMQGCPIAAFDVAGVNELIVNGETGLLAPLDDIDALARNVEYLLDHPAEAAALGERARSSIASQCGAEAVVDQMLRVYDRVVSESRAVG